MIKKIILITAMLFAVASTTQASWYMELDNVVGTLTAGDYYGMDINFVTDDPDLNLNNFSMTIDYDQTLVSYAAYSEVEYDDGGSPFPTVLWECPLPETDTGDLVYNILGSEALGHRGEFLPGVGSTKTGTVWFLVNEGVVTGDYDNIGVLVNGPVSDIVTLNEETPLVVPEGISITRVGDTYQYQAVPIPGAIWLLGSGLLGLIGIRRRR